MAWRQNPKHKQILNLEEVDNFDINPDLYTHLIIMNCIKALPTSLENHNPESGFVALIVAVDQLENVCDARNLIRADEGGYRDKVKEKKAELMKEYPGEGDKAKLFREARLANYKLKLLWRIIFGDTIREEELIM